MMKKPEKQTHSISFKLSAESYAKLEKLAEAQRRTPTDMAREYITKAVEKRLRPMKNGHEEAE